MGKDCNAWPVLCPTGCVHRHRLKGRPWTIPQGAVAGMEVLRCRQVGRRRKKTRIWAGQRRSSLNGGWVVQEAFRARVHERHQLTG